MDHEIADAGEDIMSASFAYGLAGSIVIGIGLWMLAVLFLS